jgi:hypothetical protein
MHLKRFCEFVKEKDEFQWLNEKETTVEMAVGMD